MAKSGFCGIIGIVALGMAGCASMPPFDAPLDENNRPTVSTIIDEIECEIADARDNNPYKSPELNDFKNFGQWTAAVTLTLTVDDSVGTATAGTPISFISNLSKTSTFAFGLSPTLYQLRARTYTQSYTIDIKSIPFYDECVRAQKISNGFNLEGNLGIKDQIYMGLHSFTRSQNGAAYFATKAGTKDHPATGATAGDTFGATVSFNVYYGATNIGPNWTLSTFKGPTAGLGYVRNDLHQVVMTFAPVIAKSAALPPPDPTTLKNLKDMLSKLQDEIAKLTPKPVNKPNILSTLRPTLPAEPEHELSEDSAKIFREDKKQAQDKIDQYDAAQRQYANDSVNFAAQMVAYSAKVRQYEAGISRYNAELAAYTQSLSAPNAGDAARAANQTAVTNQAINALGQTLNRP